MKIGVCTLAKPNAIFHSFFLEMLGVIQFYDGNFNPKLSRGFEAIAF